MERKYFVFFLSEKMHPSITRVFCTPVPNSEPKRSPNQIHASIIGRCRYLIAATEDVFYLEVLQRHLSDFPEAWDVVDIAPDPRPPRPLDKTYGSDFIDLVAGERKEAGVC